MEKKKVKRYVYEGLGFPIVLVNITLVKKRNVWTPAIDYNKLQKEVLLALSHKPLSLTGNEIHFIRASLEMTLEKFGKQFGVTHAAVLNWEKGKDKSAKINPTTELYIRLFILEKLNISNQIFRDTFRDFDIQSIANEQKSKATKPLVMNGSSAKRPSIRV
jgi:DNA-binding transcriptional regulator YiaG